MTTDSTEPMCECGHEYRKHSHLPVWYPCLVNGCNCEQFRPVTPPAQRVVLSDAFGRVAFKMNQLAREAQNDTPSTDNTPPTPVAAAVSETHPRATAWCKAMGKRPLQTRPGNWSWRLECEYASYPKEYQLPQVLLSGVQTDQTRGHHFPTELAAMLALDAALKECLGAVAPLGEGEAERLRAELDAAHAAADGFVAREMKVHGYPKASLDWRVKDLIIQIGNLKQSRADMRDECERLARIPDAGEVERLRAERDKLKAECNEWLRAARAFNDAIDEATVCAAQDKLDALRTGYGDCEAPPSVLEAALARVAELEAAPAAMRERLLKILEHHDHTFQNPKTYDRIVAEVKGEPYVDD